MTTIPKVRGHIRAESRIKATASPSGYKQLTSQLDKDANDSITVTGSACTGDSVVSATIDHEGGIAICVMRRGQKALVIVVPTLEDAAQPTRIMTSTAATIEALPT